LLPILRKTSNIPTLITTKYLKIERCSDIQLKN
jgi:hypothetical protein